METRSHRTTRREGAADEESRVSLSSNQPVLRDSLRNASFSVQQETIKTRFIKIYGVSAKKLQVDAIASLVNGNDTFLLAGTGYGKTRIAELYQQMFVKSQKATVLVLNPLDALGDNQVQEKQAIGIKAINLTKSTFNSIAIQQIRDCVYQFIYLSPEIFLNSEKFQDLYYSRDLQNHLVLKVVDEAHMIYSWGLVASGRAKHLASHKRIQDVGLFRPSYGNLGAQIMATNNVPLLLMSATCRPVAIEQILLSLKIPRSKIELLQGELTRPEIRVIRIYLKHPLKTAEDLLNFFCLKSEIADEKLPPMLIYSGTQDATMTVLKVLNRARGTPEDAMNGNSGFANRYTATTGPKDKCKRATDYANGLLPVMSCTQALGLGQNWTRVRIVFVMGRMNPSDTIQMIGRAGRNGCPGLGIILVEPRRGGTGKNSVQDFVVGAPMSDDD